MLTPRVIRALLFGLLTGTEKGRGVNAVMESDQEENRLLAERAVPRIEMDVPSVRY
jgi:hypothetical protein